MEPDRLTRKGCDGIPSAFRFTLEVEFFTELGSKTAEFDAAFAGGDRFLTEGKVGPGNGLSIAPSFIYQPD